MTKTKLSDDDIRELLRDGWSPRRKLTGGYEYIRLRKGSEKEVSLGRYDEALHSWIFAANAEPTKAPPAAVPKARKAASIAQVQRLKKSLKNLASKTDLQRLTRRLDKHECAASRRITTDDIFLFSSAECKANPYDFDENDKISLIFDLHDDDIAELQKHRVADQARIVKLETRNAQLEELNEQFATRIARIEGRDELNDIVCGNCGEYEFKYMVICMSCGNQGKYGLTS